MTEMTSVQQDFESAIELDHLTKDELELVANILKDFK